MNRLVSVTTLSVSDFTAFIEASGACGDAFSPIVACPRSASPVLRPSRRVSRLQSYTELFSPENFTDPSYRRRSDVEGSGSHRDDDGFEPASPTSTATTRTRGAPSLVSSYTSSCTEDDDETDCVDEDDGIIWFGRREPQSEHALQRVRLFRANIGRNVVHDKRPASGSNSPDLKGERSRPHGTVWKNILHRVRRRSHDLKDKVSAM